MVKLELTKEEANAIFELVNGKLTDALFEALKPFIKEEGTPLPSAPIPTKTAGIEDVKQLFPEDLGCMLSFEEKGDNIILKPRQFLGSDNFAKIASVVRQANGQYVSAGKASHFEVPKKV